MRVLKFSTLFIMQFFIFNVSFAENVCSIEKLVGDVKAKVDGTIREVHSLDTFAPGTYIKTGDNSFIRLVFIDKSTITIGSNSIIKIAQFSKTEPGIINVLNGQIRAKVSKSYMDIDDKDKSKLFIRTKNAAMGVRGTDFEVDYNEEVNHTTLLTFEGKVAMNAIDEKNSRRELNQDDLDKVLNRKERILVTRGLISEHHKEIKKLEARKIDEKVLNDINSQEVPNRPIIEPAKLKEIKEGKGPKNRLEPQVKKNPQEILDEQQTVKDAKKDEFLEEIHKKDRRKDERRKERMDQRMKDKIEQKIEERKEIPLPTTDVIRK